MKNFVKKILLLNLLALSLIACGGGGGSSSTELAENTDDTGTAREATAFTIEQVDVAQTFSQPIGSERQYLVPDRSAIIRAHVYTPSGTNSEEIKYYINNVQRGILTCPNTLSSSIPASPIIEYNTAKTCYATISAEDVKSGLKIKLTTENLTKEYSPNISSVNDINVVVVNIKINGNQSEFTEAQKSLLDTEIKRSLPFANINITTRSAVWDPSLSSSSSFDDNLGNSNDQWTSVVQNLEELRKSDSENDSSISNKIYYGLVPATEDFSSGISGIAYCNDCDGETSKSYSAIGLNVLYDNLWLKTMMHEIAHNFSAMHTSCNTTSTVDSNFPYDGGKMGNIPIQKTIDTTEYENPLDYDEPYDIMGYCKGERFSDYSYRKIQDYLEDNTVSVSSLVSLLAFYKIDVPKKLYISGIINPLNKTATINPISTIPSLYQSVSSGSYKLKLFTDSGLIIEHNFEVSKLADIINSSKLFNITLNQPIDSSKIIDLVIYKDDQQLNVVKPISQIQPKIPFANIQSSSQDLTYQTVNLNEEDHKVTVKWNNQLYPWLNLVHINNNGDRLTLILKATGGNITHPLNIEQGGKWEISLLQGLNVTTQIIER